MNITRINQTNFTAAYGRLEDGWHDFTKSATEIISESDVKNALSFAKQKQGINLSGNAWLQGSGTYYSANLSKGIGLILTDKTAGRFNLIKESQEKLLAFINKLYGKRIAFEKLVCKTGQIEDETLKVKILN